jgi:nucleotide-binding universal stress UspA family protein
MFKVLVPVDFSQETESVYDFLAYLSRTHEVEVTFFHVVQTPILPASMNPAVDFYSDMVAQMKDDASNRMAQLQTDARFVRCTLLSHFSTDVEGPISLQVAEYANENKFDLVLAVSKHKKALERLMLGTELLALLRYSKTPVLCLSAGMAPALKRILYASDFSDESAVVLRNLMHIAKFLGASVDVARINTPTQFISARQFATEAQALRSSVDLENLSLENPLGHPFLYNDADIVDGILHCAEDHLADLLVLATHARRGIRRLITGSITEAVIDETQLPVLVYHLPEGA